MAHHSFWRTQILFLLVLAALCVSTTAAPAAAAKHYRRPHRRTSASVPCYEDVAAKTYAAGTVFDGKARSRSAIRGGVYNVTFVVQGVFKGGEAGFARSPVRLQFAEKRDGDAECPAAGGRLVAANIKRGGKYVVFVDRVGPHSFVARGEPAVGTKANVVAVQDGMKMNAVPKLSLIGLKNVTMKVNDKLKLVCKARGNTIPSLQWYKDGMRVIGRPRDAIKIRNKNRRTTLVINKFSLRDAGHYECRATSVTGATARISSHVVTEMPNSWRVGRTCPIEHYCMNGGTCTYYETVGELSCSCADGYKGLRCEEKDVNNGSMYRPMTYFCKLGISSSYYC